MSLLIKGVEMPDSCLNCRFRTTILKNVLSPTGRTSVYACLINGMEINNWYEGKHKECPLVEIPTPHGRLIDCESDFFPTAFRYNSTDYARGWNTCLKSVLLSSTIIEAEENDEK